MEEFEIRILVEQMLEDEEFLDELQAEIAWMNSKEVDRKKNILALVTSEINSLRG